MPSSYTPVYLTMFWVAAPVFCNVELRQSLNVLPALFSSELLFYRHRPLKCVHNKSWFQAVWVTQRVKFLGKKTCYKSLPMLRFIYLCFSFFKCNLFLGQTVLFGSYVTCPGCPKSVDVIVLWPKRYISVHLLTLVYFLILLDLNFHLSPHNQFPNTIHKGIEIW